MAYVRGNLAEQLGTGTEGTALPQRVAPQREVPQFGVIEGAEQSQRQAQSPQTLLSPLVLSAIQAVKVVAIYAVALCLIALTLMGVTRIVLEQNNALATQISQAQAKTKQYEVEIAARADASRIISTAELYGMVPAQEVQTIDVGDAGAGQIVE